MKMEMARCIPETSRDEMTAEALALAYDASTNLGKRTVIDAIAATLNSIGNPLERIWIEDANGKRRTYKVEQALSVLGEQANFRYLWAIPESERRNSKSRWLTAATIDNIAVDRATLFFALPRGLMPQFVPHVTLLKLLAQADIVPQYGFGYTREYGSPDYFAVGYAYKSGIRAIDQADWVRLSALSNDRAGNPAAHPARHRSARRPILDVFPLNVLSDIHLQQKLGGVSFKEWILQNTGPESLAQIGPRCFAWFVPASRTASVSAQLKEFCLTMRDRSEACALKAGRIGSSVRYQG
jgi:hypothetical protein